MYEPPPSALDAVDAAFRDLVVGPRPLTLDGSTIGAGLPPRALRLDELRSLLLRSAAPYEARDAVLAELMRRGRQGDEGWVIGLVGIMLPGLRNVARRLTRDYPGDPDCVDAAVLAGFVDAALDSRQPAGGLAAHLLWAAYRAGRAIWLQEVSASQNRQLDDVSLVAGRVAADHVDLVLARAVCANRITADEAELIASTRIERIRVSELARRLGISFETLKHRRQRAEARLVAYLRSQDPDLSRFGRNRGLWGCGTPRGGKARSGGQCDRRQPQHHVSTRKGGEQAPRPPAQPAPGARTS